MDHLSHSEDDTAALASRIAHNLSPGDLLCLYGGLGAGKTVFARALIRALCGNPDLTVPSPTFTLLQTYDTPKGPVFHFDLYRIESAEEIDELGWDETGSAIAIVEWPERLENRLPARRLDLTIAPGPQGAGSRIIALHPHGAGFTCPEAEQER